MRKPGITFAVLLATVFLATVAEGQTSEQARRVEEEKRVSLTDTERQILESEKRVAIDYGGWVNFRYDDYENDDNDKGLADGLTETYSTDIRFWTKLTLKPPPDKSYPNEHSLYVRLKDIHNVDRGSDTDKDHDYDHDGRISTTAIWSWIYVPSGLKSADAILASVKELLTAM